MDKTELWLAFDQWLAPIGFKRKSSTWYREASGALQLVNLQRSDYGLQYYINLCWVLSGMIVEGMPWPKEHHCPIRVRLTTAYPERRTEIEEICDLENALQDRSSRINTLGQELVVPLLTEAQDVDTIRTACQNGRLRDGFITKVARRYLALEGA